MSRWCDLTELHVLRESCIWQMTSRSTWMQWRDVHVVLSPLLLSYSCLLTVVTAQQTKRVIICDIYRKACVSCLLRVGIRLTAKPPYTSYMHSFAAQFNHNCVSFSPKKKEEEREHREWWEINSVDILIYNKTKFLQQITADGCQRKMEYDRLKWIGMDTSCTKWYTWNKNEWKY